MLTPYDRLAKAVWKALASPHRLSGVDEEIDIKPWHPDFWAAAGAQLPAWMGLLSRMAGRWLVVGESETGYLTEEELRESVLEVQIGVPSGVPATARARTVALHGAVSGLYCQSGGS